ncbi:transcriptional regulator [Segetibacter aerophilus]|uniref:Transcriptional regulator n=2 Tax=Segetibacter aerophilus TaxID=670293 RepID=A0A512BCA9_9BACT|nr:transcriptional regulator [Segetibacter aerophilus]
MGEEDAEKDFYVFERNKELQRLPVNYPYRSDHFTIVLVTEGNARLKLNLIDYLVEKHNLLIISPNDVRQFLSISSNCNYIGVGFTQDFLMHSGLHKKNIDAFDFFSSQAKPVVKLGENNTEILFQLFSILHRKSSLREEVFFRDEFIYHGFSALIFEIAFLFRKSNTVHLKITRKEDLVMRFMKLLPLHFKNERGLKFYADLMFITPKYLTQTIKQITGKTAGDFIDEMVIMEAKVLLNNFSKSIGQVAEELNFSDQFYFSKFFKKHTGTNPSDYRSSL